MSYHLRGGSPTEWDQDADGKLFLKVKEYPFFSVNEEVGDQPYRESGLVFTQAIGYTMTPPVIPQPST